MNMSLAFLNGMEMVGIVILFVILFGAKKIPELARGLGQGLKEFKKSTKEIQTSLDGSDSSGPTGGVSSRDSSETTSAAKADATKRA